MYSSTIRIFFLLCCLSASLISYGQGQTYSTPGTYTWTVPPCVTSVTVQVWGGGGGGGGAASNQNQNGDEACSQGGGGGGGGFASRTYTVIPGETYTVVVGAGGNGGAGGSSSAAANDGQSGGNSTFNGPATAATGILTAFGGNGGGGAWSRNTSNGFTLHIGFDGSGGNGGNGINGTSFFTGGNGSSGRHSASCYDVSGGGGGGAGSAGNGGDAISPASCTRRTGGTGGAPEGGNGANGEILVSYAAQREAKNGLNGTELGGGGSGAMIHLHNWPNSWTSVRGGNGARGEVRIIYDLSGTVPQQPSVISGNTTLPCQGAIGLYSVTAENGVTYTWSYSGTGTISGGGNQITLDATTGGTLTVTPSNECGDGTPRTLDITLPTVPDQPGPISGNTILPCGGATEIYSVPDVPGTTYTWAYSGTGTISGSGNQITLDATTGGVLTVTPSNACGDGTPQNITLTLQNAPTQPSPISGNTTIPCGGATGTYSVTNVTGTTYTWTYSGTGTISGSGASITLNATTGGVLTVVPSSACGDGTPQQITIQLDNPPAQPSAISGNLQIPCGGATGTYSVTDVPGTTYTWTYSGVGTISGSGNQITLNASSGGVLTVTPSNVCGTGTPSSITIALNNTSGVEAVLNLPPVICKDAAPLSLTATPPGGQFTLDGNTVTSFDPSLYATGNHVILYQVTENGCLLAANDTIKVVPLPQLSSNLAASYCFNSPDVPLTFQPTGGSYSGQYVNGNTLQLAGAPAGTHTVEYTYTDANSCSNRLVHSYRVEEEIIPSFSYTVDCLKKITFNSSVSPAGTYGYSWDFGTHGNSQELHPSFSIPGNEQFPVSLTVVAASGCITTVSKPVTVAEDFNTALLEIPNVITPNGDGFNDAFELPEGIFACTDLSITLLNRWGNVVYELNEQHLSFEGKDQQGNLLTEGVYFYLIRSEKMGCPDRASSSTCSGFISVMRK